MASSLSYLLPWEFSPTILLACSISVLIYCRGLIVLKRASPRLRKPK